MNGTVWLTNMLKIEFDIDLVLIWIVILVVLILLLHVFFDVNYFLRAGLHLGYGRVFERNIKIDDDTTIYGFSFTNDLDIMFTHMNNARYLRELDFARFHFYDRTGLFQKISDSKGIVVQSACSIRYRRPISIFTAFKVTTKIIDWDEKNIYLEQMFITLSDNFVRATALSRQGVTGPNVIELMTELLEHNPSFRPETPMELKYWKSSLEESSNKLKKKE